MTLLTQLQTTVSSTIDDKTRALSLTAPMGVKVVISSGSHVTVSLLTIHKFATPQNNQTSWFI